MWSVMQLKEYSTETLQKELERRELNIPETIRFTYYVHGDYTATELMDYIEDTTDWGISLNLAIEGLKAFYEIPLVCDMDTETGKVTILGIKE